MLWLTWRQHRWALLGAVLITAVLTGWMAYLAAQMTTLHHQCHDALCPQYSPQQATLTAAGGPVTFANDLLLVVQYAPLLVGVFLGVPVLAREHEQRTLLLAWSQDVSPRRWLWTKLAVLGLSAAALTAVVSAASDHLAHVLNTVGEGNLFKSQQFLDAGMLPLAVGVCWFAVGVAFGAAIRRTLPAAFGVVAGFVGLALVVQRHYATLLPPLSFYRRFGNEAADPVGANSLVIKGDIRIGPGLASNLFDSSGNELDYAALRRICPDALGADGPFSCFARNHVQSLVLYQPSSRIPAVHLILASGYLGLGAVALVAVWLIVRRTSLTAG